MGLDDSVPLNISIFLDLQQSDPLCAQSIVRRLHDAGHHIILFACSSAGKLEPLFEEPPSSLTSPKELRQELLHNKVLKSDAILLITDHTVYEVPRDLKAVTQHFNGHIYSWISYGVNCALLGGLVHNRRVAMQMRWLLEDSQNLLVGRVLPRPCSFAELYSVDPMWETAEPCVL